MDTNTIEQKIDIPSRIKAPINKDDVIGSLHYSYNNVSYTANLIAASNVKSSHLLLKFLLLFIFLFLLLTVYKLRKSKLKRKRLRMIKKL